VNNNDQAMVPTGNVANTISNQMSFAFPPVKADTLVFENCILRPAYALPMSSTIRPHGGYLPAATPTGRLDDVTLIHNGGEMYRLTFATTQPIPAGAGIQISLSIMTYTGPNEPLTVNRTSAAKVLTRSQNNTASVILTLAGGTAAGTSYFDLGVIDPTTGISPGYNTLRVNYIKLIPGVTTDVTLPPLIMGVTQWWNQSNTTATNVMNTNTTPVYINPALNPTNTTTNISTPQIALMCNVVSADLFDQIVTRAAFANYRVLSSCLLCTNVTSTQNMEGVMRQCDMPVGYDWYNVSYGDFTSQTLDPSTGYTGPLARGGYTWFKPPENIPSFKTSPSASAWPQNGAASGGTNLGVVPLIDLSNEDAHVMIISDQDVATRSTFLLKGTVNIECEPPGAVFGQGLASRIKPSDFDDVRIMLFYANSYTENWTHLSQLWAQLKASAKKVLKIGVDASAKAALAEIAAGVAGIAML